MSCINDCCDCFKSCNIYASLPSHNPTFTLYFWHQFLDIVYLLRQLFHFILSLLLSDAKSFQRFLHLVREGLYLLTLFMPLLKQLLLFRFESGKGGGSAVEEGLKLLLLGIPPVRLFATLPFHPSSNLPQSTIPRQSQLLP